jgi:oligopeptidase A
MLNPLLEEFALPPFQLIEAAHIAPALARILDDNRAELATLADRAQPGDFASTVLPLEALEDRLQRAWAPIRHLHGVKDSESLREAYKDSVLKITEYQTELGQNEQLYALFRAVADGDEFASLNDAEQQLVRHAVRDFELAGIGLPVDARERFKTLQQQLVEVQTKFEENLLDATRAWRITVTDEQQLRGLPESALEQARQSAQKAGEQGWLFTLDVPSYLPVMRYAEDGEFRRTLYEAYVTRASDQGPRAGQHDNAANMTRILELRRELAELLGFANYAQYSLATKMARDEQHVLSFLNDLVTKSKSQAQHEFNELKDYAAACGHSNLQAWDVAFYAEKLRIEKFAFSQEELRPYFPADKVTQGLFDVVNRLYGLDIKEVTDVETWHEDVRFFHVKDRQGQLRGMFYADLYARPDKRGGAWMDECVNRRRVAEHVQVPVAFLTCNFTPPIGEKVSLLTHEEVVTLFHEFGHGLHHMLTLIDRSAVSGINGVAWDAVELPSQFTENWCWEYEGLALIGGHHETGARLPRELFEKMLAAKNFHTALQMLRQLEFALFDFHAHISFDPAAGRDIDTIIKQVRDEVAVVPYPHFNRFQNGFAHIFAGGYAAGYYSYKWAEVLAADAFEEFKENGIFDRETGARFMQCILERGGSRDALDLFIEFRGREPQVDALLRQSGISVDA